MKLNYSIIVLLCATFTGKAQTRRIEIAGSKVVCIGSIYSYTITSAYTSHVHYKWSLSACGKIAATSSGSVQIDWRKAGTAILRVDGLDEKKQVVESGSAQITVERQPPPPYALLGPDTVCFDAPIAFTAKNEIKGTIFEWATPGGICNFTSGDSTEAAFDGKSPATLMVWRVTDDAPHCHSDTLKKSVYRADIDLHIIGERSVYANSFALYSTTSKCETYEWKIYNELAGSVDTNGRNKAKVLWNDIPPGYQILKLRTRMCDLFWEDTIRINVKRPLPPKEQSTANSKKNDHPKPTNQSPFIAHFTHYATCANDTQYNVNLIDNSDYLGGHAPYKYLWYVNGKEIGETTTSGYQTLLPPGTYLLGEKVYYGDDTDNRMAAESLYLEAIPKASFTYARDTTCAKKASIHFLDRSVSQSPLTYEWNFGDAVHSTVKNPFRVFAFPGEFWVTLKVTDSYGCSSSDMQHVRVRKLIQYDGNMIGGGIFDSIPVLSAYIPSPSGHFENYYWMRDLDTLRMSKERYNYISRSGRYWVQATDNIGCYGYTQPIHVNIIHPPHALIRTASKIQCCNIPYTLNGWAGDDTTLNYKWLKNGRLVGTADTYTDSSAQAATDTFQLIISASCYGKKHSDTSKPYIAIVPAGSPP